MPTYSYACTACDHQFDIVQSFTDDSLTECDQCDGKLRKVFNSVGIVFKGSGFYRNDSRAATTSTSPATSTSAAASTTSSSEKSSSTPAPKAPSSTK
ncbi:FmdB family transcriptional regulator [Hoyosella rhizosphaerae]|uniref:FmdB family zinc ribbon protein n=1 Tax=Hoyosella rhizosphaerae TaxID=1755582 RepID=UPI00166CD992|nr:FmdB family zinc ribbon protein [Hoyosella rhizosphaerae]MBN4925780.1 FmdB family transcriptional regulator [Hoyosella rhizosphaerae]